MDALVLSPRWGLCLCSGNWAPSQNSAHQRMWGFVPDDLHPHLWPDLERRNARGFRSYWAQTGVGSGLDPSLGLEWMHARAFSSWERIISTSIDHIFCFGFAPDKDMLGPSVLAGAGALGLAKLLAVLQSRAMYVTACIFSSLQCEFWLNECMPRSPILGEPSSLTMPFTACVKYVPFVLL